MFNKFILISYILKISITKTDNTRVIVEIMKLALPGRLIVKNEEFYTISDLVFFILLNNFF